MTYKIEVAAPTSFTLIEVNADYTHASGDTVLWSVVTYSNAASPAVTVSSNTINLTQGEYYLQGSLGMLRNTDTDTYDVRFYDATTNNELTESDGFHNAISQGYRDTGSNVFQAHLVLSGPLNFYMKSTGSSGTVKADSSSIFVLRAG